MAFGIRRAPKLGRDARAVLPAGERLIAWGARTMEPKVAVDYVLASDRALYLDGERLRWDLITKATWNEPDLVVHVHDAAGRPVRRILCTMAQPGDLPGAVFALVTASVVVSESLDLGDGMTAKAIARRDGDGGQIWWSVIFAEGENPADPDLRARADSALGELRSALGI